jgi:hypothetical protein
MSIYITTKGGSQGLITGRRETSLQYAHFHWSLVLHSSAQRNTSYADGRGHLQPPNENRSGEGLKQLTGPYLVAVPFVLFGLELRFSLCRRLELLSHPATHVLRLPPLSLREICSNQPPTMYISNALSFLSLLGMAKAASIPEYQAPAPEVDESTVYDAIVVGGGPSGLSAVSGLARVRRNVLLIDSGAYRNDATRHMHDVIGMDGKIEYLRLGFEMEVSC